MKDQETIREEGARRFAVCWECKNFWWAFPLRPTICNGCTQGKEIPSGEPSEECSSFKPIDKSKNA